MLYGFYPEVINNQGNERETIKNLVNSYLYRDILAFSDIRKPEVLEKLLQALALQVGSEVNYNELSHLIGINKITVQKYIEILEKGYIVFRLNSFSRNLRNEIKQKLRNYETSYGEFLKVGRQIELNDDFYEKIFRVMLIFSIINISSSLE